MKKRTEDDITWGQGLGRGGWRRGRRMRTRTRWRWSREPGSLSRRSKPGLNGQCTKYEKYNLKLNVWSIKFFYFSNLFSNCMCWTELIWNVGRLILIKYVNVNWCIGDLVNLYIKLTLWINLEKLLKKLSIVNLLLII